jgi:hypothetical protein
MPLNGVTSPMWHDTPAGPYGVGRRIGYEWQTERNFLALRLRHEDPTSVFGE